MFESSQESEGVAGLGSFGRQDLKDPGLPWA